MNDGVGTCIWPWHAYLRDLAAGITRDAGSGRSQARAPTGIQGIKFWGDGGCANSWLGRPRRGLQPALTL